jgi:hypothetical protein
MLVEAMALALEGSVYGIGACVGRFSIRFGIRYTDLYFCIVRLKRRDRSHLEDLPYWVEDLWDCNHKIHVIQLIIILYHLIIIDYESQIGPNAGTPLLSIS